ncbi:MAG: hypothetical protein ACPGZP_12495 [Panacagrimonas sp.]
MSLDSLSLPNHGRPTAEWVTAGQPSAEQLAQVQQAGVRHVIDLRPPAEDHGYDEAAEAKKLDMKHQVVPIAGPGDLTLERAKELDAAIAATNGEATLIHCASSNRVGALLALRAAWLQNASHEDAMKLGRAAGLTKMEGAVQQLLERGPA